MDYLDTSYVLALAIKTDANHRITVDFEKNVIDPMVSELVAIETHVYFSQILATSSNEEDYNVLEEKIEAMPST
ncbi:MAG: hypothetical protein DRO18_00480 [Thermoprotei archaeon]|nr:MAG: hypothetical protein DRO18_00480 [Thermoprotei archaeon]